MEKFKAESLRIVVEFSARRRPRELLAMRAVFADEEHVHYEAARRRHRHIRAAGLHVDNHSFVAVLLHHAALSHGHSRARAAAAAGGVGGGG